MTSTILTCKLPGQAAPTHHRISNKRNYRKNIGLLNHSRRKNKSTHYHHKNKKDSNNRTPAPTPPPPTAVIQALVDHSPVGALPKSAILKPFVFSLPWFGSSFESYSLYESSSTGDHANHACLLQSVWHTILTTRLAPVFVFAAPLLPVGFRV